MASTEEEYDSFPATTDPPAILFDQGSLAIVSDTRRAGRGATSGGSRASFRSAATTQLATEVGSTVGPRRKPFLKSITFFDPKVYYRKACENDEKHENADDDGERARWSGDADGADENDNRNSFDDREAADDATCDVNDMSHWDIALRDPTAEELSVRRGVIDRLRKNKGPRLVVEAVEGLVEFSNVQSGDRLVSINKKKIRSEEYSADEVMVYMRSCLENDGVLNVTTEDPQGELIT